MEWTSRIREEEDRLKVLVEALGRAQGRGIRRRMERVHLEQALRGRIADARSFLDDCLSGRNTYEQHLMEYRLRVEFPLFCHLESIFSINVRSLAACPAG
jgi:hypothetical protein